MDLVALIDEKRRLIEAALPDYLPQLPQENSFLTEAMRYSLLAGGKRLRPILAILAYEAAGGLAYEEIMPAACALEYVHTFTLIHDDLPAMDNDDYRRGKLSNHKKFGEGMAILAGDGLMIDGLGLVCHSGAPCKYVVRALKEFTEILGSSGVTLGQADDLYGGEANAKFLRHIHMRKTALFISFSIRIGAILGRAEEATLSELHRAGVLAGMGFQIMDDILDVRSSLKDLGKTPGKDSEDNKLTYPSVYGLEYSERMAKGYARRAKRIFSNLGEKWNTLSLFTDHLVMRNK